MVCCRRAARHDDIARCCDGNRASPFIGNSSPATVPLDELPGPSCRPGSAEVRTRENGHSTGKSRLRRGAKLRSVHYRSTGDARRVRQPLRHPGVSTGPRGRRGCSRGGSPQSRGSGAQPQEARRRRRFFRAFLTDFHEVLLLFWDQLKPKNGYKYSHSSC